MPLRLYVVSKPLEALALHRVGFAAYFKETSRPEAVSQPAIEQRVGAHHRGPDAAQALQDPDKATQHAATANPTIAAAGTLAANVNHCEQRICAKRYRTSLPIDVDSGAAGALLARFVVRRPRRRVARSQRV